MNMITTLITLALLSSGLIASIIWPVHLPAGIMSALDTFAGYLWQWEGLLPISTILQDLWFLFFVSLMLIVFRVVVGLIALANGSGKPEL